MLFVGERVRVYPLGHVEKGGLRRLVGRRLGVLCFCPPWRSIGRIRSGRKVLCEPVVSGVVGLQR